MMCLKLLFVVVEWRHGINTGSKRFIPEVKKLYQKLLDELQKFGAVIVEEKKTSFHIKGGGAAFAGVHPRKTYFILNIVSTAPIKSPRIVEQE